MNDTPPPLPAKNKKSAGKSHSPAQVMVRVGVLFVSFFPAVWLLTHQKTEPKIITIALVGAAILCVVCALVLFRGVFKSRLSYVLVSLALAAAMFGVNLAVGLFLGCLHLFKDV
jgi:hypothetical protein